MSGTFQLIGTAVGYAVGGPIGAAVGGSLGGLVDQEVFGKSQKGPRVDEFRATGSAVGAPIIRAYGNNRMAGELIWFGRLRERKRKKKVGGIAGFGGQKVVNYEYYATFAVGLQEGPDVCLRRIRINGKTWWEDPGYANGNADYLDQQRRLIEFGPTALTDEELTQYNETALSVAASQGRSEFFTFYPGDPDQAADPIIQGYLGASAPAYRDTAYVVFKELPVTEYGGALPLIEFETVSGPTEDGQTIDFWVPQTIGEWVEDGRDPRDAETSYEYRYDPPGAPPVSAWGDEATALAAVATEQGMTYTSTVVACKTSSGSIEYSPYDPGVALGDEEILQLVVNTALIDEVEKFYGDLGLTIVGNVITALIGYGLPTNELFWWSGISDGVDYNANFCPGGIFIIVPFGDSPPAGGNWAFRYNNIPNWDMYESKSDVIEVRRVVSCPPAICEDKEPLPENPDYCVDSDGNVYPEVTFTETSDGTFLQLAVIRVLDGEVVQYPLGPVLNTDYAPDAARNTLAFWEPYYLAAVAAGTAEAGWDFNSAGTGGTGSYPRLVTTACAVDIQTEAYCAAEPVNVADVIEAECLKRNLTAADLNTSLVTDTLWGMKLDRNVSGREAIEQLRTFSWLDAVESDGVLKFVPRGLAAVATLTLDDLGAHEYGSQRPPAIEVTRVDDIQLPREVRVSYTDQDADFQPGQQYDRRLVTDAVNTQDITLGIAMTGDRGKKIATIALYDQWAARKALQFSLGPQWLALEPTDTILIPDLETYTRVRIDQDDLALPGLRTMQAVRDEQSLYDRAASGPTPQIPDAAESNNTAQGPTTVVILDLPTMGVGDDDAGYWVAMYGTLESWQAAEGFRSLDGGTTYDSVVESGSATAGFVVSPYDGSEMVVRVYGGELLSTTPEAAAAGTNRFAVGLAGRWVIGTFETVTDNGGGEYVLSDLTMGLFDTEWAVEVGGSPSVYRSQVGDAFVMLETVSRVDEDDSIVGTLVEFRGVTSGTAFDNAPEQSFTARGNGRGFVASFGQNTPPSHSEGATHVVGTAPVAGWSGSADYIAHDVDGAWIFEYPETGRQVRTTAGQRYEFTLGSPSYWILLSTEVETTEAIGQAQEDIEQAQEDIEDLQNRFSFGTIAVATQSNIVADAGSDTLTIAAGAKIDLTTNATTDTVTIAVTGAASTAQADEMMAGFIASPSAKSYKVVVKAAHGGTITETTTICVSGTCTATFKINTTALGGTANSVSSSEQSQAHSSSNVFSAGDDIVITISSVSTCVDMSFSIKYARTYA